MPPFQKFLHPSARALRAHWRGEKSFLPRACRARKQIQLYFVAEATKLYEILDDTGTVKVFVPFLFSML